MKDFLEDYGIFVVFLVGIITFFSFITLWVVYDGEKDKEMAKNGMCLTKIVGSETRVWYPCK